MKDVSVLTDQLSAAAKRAKRYAVPIFLLALAIMYGLLVYRVQVLNNTEPSQSQIDEQSQTASVPRIDPATLKQLQSLRDNSVSVQTLFEQTRSNPFQE